MFTKKVKSAFQTVFLKDLNFKPGIVKENKFGKNNPMAEYISPQISFCYAFDRLNVVLFHVCFTLLSYIHVAYFRV